MATHSSILAEKISQIEKPGRLLAIHGVANRLGKLDTTEHTCTYLLKYKGHKIGALPSLWV